MAIKNNIAYRLQIKYKNAYIINTILKYLSECTYFKVIIS